MEPELGEHDTSQQSYFTLRFVQVAKREKANKFLFWKDVDRQICITGAY